ncbi:2-phospho-L-lactate transferase [Novosphingobium sp. TH158]|uniref:2-phospho-L-lactate transferase n=1 Tax=Novosphingobium sp. TH158 TaxID=2067455 RepID=UPI000C7BE7D7|nr:2-phospho-L-lactate transferase [Novosphingobium sp. TH158]PLK26197.1 2-phospho-L-lactate transferase [Novosphingobium sp. TH158]
MSGHVLALSGGVGGAKLAAGLGAVLAPGRLTVAVNTGDDFEHLGLTICPDIDSVLYTMSGRNDRQRGWGLADETWRTMEQLRSLGEEDWFNLGDRDMATHIARSWRLRQGASLSDVTAHLARAMGIGHAVFPMSDDPVRTQVCTPGGWTDFQRWFVGEQCGPAVTAVRFAGTPGAAMAQGFAEALARPDLAAIVICPSNPYLSVDPVLAVDGVRAALGLRQVPCIAVSPLIGGRALKGPLSKLFSERGLAGTNLDIAAHYGALIDHIVIDRTDAKDADALRTGGLAVTLSETLMKSAEDQARLARAVLAAVGVEC